MRKAKSAANACDDSGPAVAPARAPRRWFPNKLLATLAEFLAREGRTGLAGAGGRRVFAPVRGLFQRRSPDRLNTAVAAAETGDVSTALSVIGPDVGALSRRDRERLALAIGRWSPHVAMGLAPVSASLLSSALALRAGELERGRRIFPSNSSKLYAVDHDLMAASLATGRADHRAARRLANQAFARNGLAPPLDETLDAPIALGSFGCAPLPPQRGPLVSVVMPARNAAATLAIAIRSVLQQTWQDIELIVVDDASTDDTFDVAAAACAGDHRARIIRLEHRGGAYAARNAGLRAARGQFVTFNDADDWSHPQRIAHDVQPLLARPGLYATESRLVRLDGAGQFTAARVFPLVRSNPASLMFRREAVLHALGAFEEVPFGADEEFTARLVACFGPAALLRQKTLLSVASAGQASLTGAAATGVSSVEGMRARTAYREDWRRRHVEMADARVANSPGTNKSEVLGSLVRATVHRSEGVGTRQ